MTIEAIFSYLMQRGDFQFASENHDLRILFDPFCSQYQKTTLEQKRKVIRRFESVGIHRETLVNAYKELYNSLKRYDIVANADLGLKAIEMNSIIKALKWQAKKT